MTTISTTAGKFREMAAKLEIEIGQKRAPRRENTPKQQKEAHAQRIEANHLDRVRVAMLKLADARDSLSLPPSLAGITTKTQLLKYLRTRIDCPSYYALCDTGEFYDKTDVAVKLREFLAGAKTEAEKQAEAERQRLAKIETLERDVKFRPIPGFFPTPPAVIRRMIELADVAAYHHVLEPSAGKGDIADALNAAGVTDVVTCEVVPMLCEILTAKGHKTVCGDFLERFSLLDPVNGQGEVTPEMQQFERVLMNPPFERGQDVDHVRHAHKLLRKGGRLVSVMSEGPFFRQDKKSTDFREWFAQVGGEREDLPADAFKDSFRNTGVKTCLVVIDAA